MDGRPVWGQVYWPWFLGVFVMALLVPEVYALVTHPADTLSAYVWRSLRVRPHQAVGVWDAARLLTFGGYAVVVAWLGGHFWFGLWR